MPGRPPSARYLSMPEGDIGLSGGTGATMTELLLDVLSNIVANLLFWVILGVVFWSVSKAGRRRFVTFFGFRAQSTIDIYVSNKWDPVTSERPKGFSLALHESMAAQAAARLIQSSQLRAPEIVRGLIDGIWLNSALNSTTIVTPAVGEVSPHVGGPAVVIGSAVRNSLRRLYIGAELPRAALSYERTPAPADNWDTGASSIEIRHRSGDRHVVNADMQLMIIEKVRDTERGAVLFFCLGSRGDTSWLAVEYLCRNWKILEREFGVNDFVVCLGLPNVYDYRTKYEQPLRLAAMSM